MLISDDVFDELNNKYIFKINRKVHLLHSVREKRQVKGRTWQEWGVVEIVSLELCLIKALVELGKYGIKFNFACC